MVGVGGSSPLGRTILLIHLPCRVILPVISSLPDRLPVMSIAPCYRHQERHMTTFTAKTAFYRSTMALPAVKA